MSNFLPGFGTSWTKAKPHTQFTPFSDKNERSGGPFLLQLVYMAGSDLKKMVHSCHYLAQANRPINCLDIIQDFLRLVKDSI